MIITIDGPAGSGKSTVADILAEKLGFIHFNSGSLYRAITAYLDDIGFNIEDIKPETEIPHLDLKVRLIENSQRVYVNDIDFTPHLRKNRISTLVAYVAANKFCRVIIDDCQRKFCSQHNIVIEGRDLGSHVFPNADIKFYLDCSIKERARRRFLEEKAKNSNITLAQIEEQIEERDYLDKTRKIAPLVIPTGAIIVDSSSLSIEEVVQTMQNQIKSKLKSF